jgi:hypothetical protein
VPGAEWTFVGAFRQCRVRQSTLITRDTVEVTDLPSGRWLLPWGRKKLDGARGKTLGAVRRKD